MSPKKQPKETPAKVLAKPKKSQQSQEKNLEELVKILQYSNIDKFPLFTNKPLPIKLKVLALNANGLRAALSKEISVFLRKQKPDIIFIGESKIGVSALSDFLQSDSFKQSYLYQNYNYMFACSSLKQGYASTACFVQNELPIQNLQNKLNSADSNSIINTEGRFLQLDINEKLTFIHVYVPNVGRNQDDIMETRIKFEKTIRDHINVLQEKGKTVVYCGDLNVVDTEIDIHNWKQNLGSPGMTEEERAELQLLKKNCNLIDTFRYLNPGVRLYTWFSYRSGSRERRLGWRIDYFFISKDAINQVQSSQILEDIAYSDHVPIVLELML